MDTSYYSKNYNIEIKNYTISIKKKIDLNQPICFHIGVQLLSNYMDTNLITELHKKKIIKSYNYFYRIYTEDEVYLILDASLNDKDELIYQSIKPLSHYSNFRLIQRWGLTLDYITLDNSTIHHKEDIKAVFDINLGCIVGSFLFKDYLEQYFKKNNIFVLPRNYNQKYYIYFFEKNMEKIEKIKNLNIKFYHSELNYHFILNSNDLLVEKTDGYYFLILFDLENKDSWKFGTPFLKKYNIIYNQDKKLMYFQIENINSNKIINNNSSIIDKENNNINKNNNILLNKYKKIILIVLLVIIFIIIIVLFFGILIGKKIFGIRKVKVNELLELYDYSSNSKNN